MLINSKQDCGSLLSQQNSLRLSKRSETGWAHAPFPVKNEYMDLVSYIRNMIKQADLYPELHILQSFKSMLSKLITIDQSPLTVNSIDYFRKTERAITSFLNDFVFPLKKKETSLSGMLFLQHSGLPTGSM